LCSGAAAPRRTRLTFWRISRHSSTADGFSIFHGLSPTLLSRASINGLRVLCTLGVREVTTVSEVSAEAIRLGGSIDGVFIPGGNTFRLLARLRATGVAALLAERVGAGLPCYGGSAGAIVLGAHVGTCGHLDRNDVGLTDLTGLNLCGGQAIWCHHNDGDAGRLIEFVRATELEVFSLSENSGLRIGPDEIGSLGSGRVSRWAARGATEIRRWKSEVAARGRVVTVQVGTSDVRIAASFVQLSPANPPG
jgi:cyanophycinase-like exopeptidase